MSEPASLPPITAQMQSENAHVAAHEGSGHAFALIDYNNVPLSIRRKGLKYLADLIVDIAGPERLASIKAITLRLYDGWYRGERTTRGADDVRLAIDRQRSFVAVNQRSTGTLRYLIRIEQAFSLFDEPSKTLFHTYRTGRTAGAVRLQRGRDVHCQSAVCPLDVVSEFIARGTCPVPSCVTECDSLLLRDEQKLIDSMMCVDLIHLAMNDYRFGIVVSSDDDLIPAIRYACRRRMFLLHVGTHQGRRVPESYVDGLSESYFYKTI